MNIQNKRRRKRIHTNSNALERTRLSLAMTAATETTIPEEIRWRIRATSSFEILRTFLHVLNTNAHNDEIFSNAEDEATVQNETIYGDRQIDELIKEITHECNKVASKKHEVESAESGVNISV